MKLLALLFAIKTLSVYPARSRFDEMLLNSQAALDRLELMAKQDATAAARQASSWSFGSSDRESTGGNQRGPGCFSSLYAQFVEGSGELCASMSDARRGAIAAGMAICHVDNAGRRSTDIPEACESFLPGGPSIMEELSTRQPSTTGSHTSQFEPPNPNAGDGVSVQQSAAATAATIGSQQHGTQSTMGSAAVHTPSEGHPHTLSADQRLGMVTRACTRAMSPLVFNAYTEFFAGLDSACFFLEAQATQEGLAETVISQLALSQAMHGMLNAQVDASVELLSHQRSASEHTRQLAAGLSEAQGRFQAVDRQLNQSLTHVTGSLGAVQHGVDVLQLYSHALVGAQQYIVGHFDLLQACLFWAGAAGGVHLLSGTKTTADARLSLVILVVGGAALEWAIVQSWPGVQMRWQSMLWVLCFPVRLVGSVLGMRFQSDDHEEDQGVPSLQGLHGTGGDIQRVGLRAFMEQSLDPGGDYGRDNLREWVWFLRYAFCLASTLVLSWHMFTFVDWPRQSVDKLSSVERQLQEVHLAVTRLRADSRAKASRPPRHLIRMPSATVKPRCVDPDGAARSITFPLHKYDERRSQFDTGTSGASCRHCAASGPELSVQSDPTDPKIDPAELTGALEDLSHSGSAAGKASTPRDRGTAHGTIESSSRHVDEEGHDKGEGDDNDPERYAAASDIDSDLAVSGHGKPDYRDDTSHVDVDNDDPDAASVHNDPTTDPADHTTAGETNQRNNEEASLVPIAMHTQHRPMKSKPSLESKEGIAEKETESPTRNTRTPSRPRGGRRMKRAGK